MLTGCNAAGAILGTPGPQPPAQKLDCTGANLAGGDFTRADLSWLNLTGATAAGARFDGAVLDHAILDGAGLRDAVAAGASLRYASLVGCQAQGANCTHADLSYADLTRARMGTRAYLASLDGDASKFAAELDSKPYPQPDLMAAFQARGIPVGAEDAVSVVRPGQVWELTDPAGPYRLELGPSGQIDVFLDPANLRPAVLAGATCLGAKGPRASLAGADLRGVQWHGAGATLSQADLAGAALCGAMLAQLDLTQAYLDGADLSSAVLVEATIRGCRVGSGADGRAVSLEHALLHEADFSDSTLLGALLVDAAVATAAGVPLFTLPATDTPSLTQAGIATLAPAFAAAGYPLGQEPTVTRAQQWLLDNSACTDQSAPKHYRVSIVAGQLWVFDDHGSSLFRLLASEQPLLAQPTASQRLVDAFAGNGFTLVPGAPITVTGWWEVTPGADAPAAGPVAYPTLRVFSEAGLLRVYGSVLVLLRDWAALLPSGLAFKATQALDTAMDPPSIGPCGLPRADVPKRIDWTSFWTVRVASQTTNATLRRDPGRIEAAG